MQKIILILMCGLLTACSGKGVDHRLNASNGFDDTYRQGINEAFTQMTPKQQELFNWAVDGYGEADFKKEFGSHTTPREVVEREIKIQSELAKNKIAELEKELKNKAGEVKANDERRQKAFDIIGKYVVTVSPKLETTKETKQVCEGVICEDRVFKTYKLSYSGENPTNLNLYPLVIATITKGNQTKQVSWYQEPGKWIYTFKDNKNDWEGATVTFKVDMDQTTMDVKPKLTPLEEAEGDEALANSDNAFAKIALAAKAMGGFFGEGKDEPHYAVPRKLPEQLEIERQQGLLKEFASYSAELDKKKDQ